MKCTAIPRMSKENESKLLQVERLMGKTDRASPLCCNHVSPKNNIFIKPQKTVTKNQGSITRSATASIVRKSVRKIPKFSF